MFPVVMSFVLEFAIMISFTVVLCILFVNKHILSLFAENGRRYRKLFRGFLFLEKHNGREKQRPARYRAGLCMKELSDDPVQVGMDETETYIANFYYYYVM